MVSTCGKNLFLILCKDFINVGEMDYSVKFYQLIEDIRQFFSYGPKAHR